MQIESHPPLAARDRVFWSVGRNLANFQSLEHSLKRLIPLMRFEGEVETLPALLARRGRALRKATLGRLLDEYRMVYGPDDVEVSSSEDAPVHGMRIGVSMAGTRDLVERERREMRALLRERNRLVHTRLVACRLDDEMACESLANELDEQNRRIVGILQRLGTHWRAIELAFQAIASDDAESEDDEDSLPGD